MMLDFNAMSLFFVVYLIKKQRFFICDDLYLSYIIYLAAALLFTAVCLGLMRFLPDEIISGGVKEVEIADGSYLPSFLGYFFVALSIGDRITLITIAVIIFVLTYYSQTLYFNPLFLIFGYRFYYITVDNGMKLFVLSKRAIKGTEGLDFKALKRINDYTFIDRSHK